MRKITFEDLYNGYLDTLDKANFPTKEIEKIQNELFKKYCAKQYQEKCDPFFCTFRMNEQCEFIQKLGEFNKKLMPFGLQIFLF